MTVCIDTNVLLGFFNNEPDKVESCTAFFQLLFTKRIKSVVATITRGKVRLGAGELTGVATSVQI